MQLVAYGAQDVYLTGNPQITFWKVTYRRSHELCHAKSIEQTFNGQAGFRSPCDVHPCTQWRPRIPDILPSHASRNQSSKCETSLQCSAVARFLGLQVPWFPREE